MVRTSPLIQSGRMRSGWFQERHLVIIKFVPLRWLETVRVFITLWRWFDHESHTRHTIQVNLRRGWLVTKVERSRPAIGKDSRPRREANDRSIRRSYQQLEWHFESSLLSGPFHQIKLLPFLPNSAREDPGSNAGGAFSSDPAVSSYLCRRRKGRNLIWWDWHCWSSHDLYASSCRLLRPNVTWDTIARRVAELETKRCKRTRSLAHEIPPSRRKFNVRTTSHSFHFNRPTTKKNPRKVRTSTYGMPVPPSPPANTLWERIWELSHHAHPHLR